MASCENLRCEKFGITDFAKYINLLSSLLWENIIHYCGEKLIWEYRSPIKIVSMLDVSMFFYSLYIQFMCNLVFSTEGCE